MPELPEVETIRRGLDRKIRGKRIRFVDVRMAKTVNLPAGKFEKALSGLEIKEVARRAKLLMIRLSEGMSLFIHLKMTGQLVYVPAGGKKEPGKHARIVFSFEDGSRLFFNDMRQFGYVKLLDEKAAERELSRHEFGPEPLEKTFMLETFKRLLAKNGRKKIKPLLMDPRFVAGIGNIYASEICFYAKVNPEKPAGDLTGREIRGLYDGIGKILKKAIELKGTSAENYVTASGEEGKYEKMLKVYKRDGEKCPRCGVKIRREKVGGRGTFFCPDCQK